MVPNTYYSTPFKIGVKNKGKSGAKACAMRVSITGSSGLLYTHDFPVPGLKEGTHTIITCQYHFAVADQCNLVANVDINGDVTETDEGNNYLSHSFEVVDTVGPDLTLIDIVHYGDVTLGSTHKVWGKVKNIGNVTAGISKLRMICSPKEKNRSKTIPALPSGQEWPFEFGFEYWTFSTKVCGIWVDADEDVAELNEDNNHVRYSFKVKSGTIFD
jgi:hypothetical protein